jgi:hypothetical protein
MNPLTFDVIRLGRDREDGSEVPCPACHHDLTFHQPDPECPDRLLGTCEACRTWFLVHAAAGLMLRLPDEEDVRDADPVSRGPDRRRPPRSAARRGRPPLPPGTAGGPWRG